MAEQSNKTVMVSSIEDYLKEIKEINGSLIYRGETNAKNEKVSSGLYRLFEDIEEKPPNADFSKAIKLNRTELKKYFPIGANEQEMNVELQHYAGKSNYIDFSENPLIGLFFACYEKPGERKNKDKHGRVIVLNSKDERLTKFEEGETDLTNLKEDEIVILKPTSKSNRIIYQSSVLLYPREGVIGNDYFSKIIIVNGKDKAEILDKLDNIYAISEDTVYNDLAGYIDRQEYTLKYKLVGKVNTKFLQEELLKKPKSERTKADEYIEFAFNYLNKQKFDVAIDFFNMALESEPDNAMPHLGLGLMYHKLGKVEDAEKHYKKALELDPSSAVVHNNLGELYREQGEYEVAEKYLKRALELDPNNAAAHNNLGQLYRRQGKYEAAEEHLKKALELEPNSAVAHHGLGLLYLKQEEYKAAEKYLMRALELAPDDAVIHNNLCVSYLGQEKYGDAERHLKIAIKLNPNLASVHSHLATLYAITGNRPGALKRLGIALSLDKKYVLEYIYSIPAWEVYRNDADFKALLEK